MIGRPTEARPRRGKNINLRSIWPQLAGISNSPMKNTTGIATITPMRNVWLPRVIGAASSWPRHDALFPRAARVVYGCLSLVGITPRLGKVEIGRSEQAQSKPSCVWCGLVVLPFILSSICTCICPPQPFSSPPTRPRHQRPSWIHPRKYQTSSRSLTISLQNVFSLSKKYALQLFCALSSPCLLQIGFGNWGSVWLCRPKSSSGKVKNMEVAVKLVHRSKTSTTAARVRSLYVLSLISPRLYSHPWACQME